LIPRERTFVPKESPGNLENFSIRHLRESGDPFESLSFGVKFFDCANRETGAPGNRFLHLKMDVVIWRADVSPACAKNCVWDVNWGFQNDGKRAEPAKKGIRGFFLEKAPWRSTAVFCFRGNTQHNEADAGTLAGFRRRLLGKGDAPNWGWGRRRAPWGEYLDQSFLPTIFS
jgi:hypothetical protein